MKTPIKDQTEVLTMITPQRKRIVRYEKVERKNILRKND
jgi:hypothetical protein